jgi:hypothetical protein
MDEIAFRKELERYKVIRTRNYIESDRRPRRPLAPPEAPSIAHDIGSTSAASAVISTTTPSDFWVGFDAFMKCHVPNAALREKVARSFDKVSTTRELFVTWAKSCSLSHGHGVQRLLADGLVESTLMHGHACYPITYPLFADPLWPPQGIKHRRP